jgi:hypothetical protein
MPKGQITDADLAGGLKGLAGFSALGGAKPQKDSPFRDSRAEPKTVEIRRPAEKPTERSAKAEPSGKRAELRTKTEAGEGKQTILKKAEAAPAKKQKATTRKADIYTERVTLQISPEMRDQVDFLARELQRTKTSKDERITSNTVIRVAIRHFVENFSVGKGESINGEEDLLSALKKRGL